MENNYEHIPSEKFEFAQRDEYLHDTKLKTKARGYFADAFLRFKKNKSSVVAACIIGFLIIFSIVAPLISPYTIKDKDTVYTNTPPYISAIAKSGIGLFDGAVTLSSQSDLQLETWHAFGKETGMDPVIKIVGEQYTESIKRGQVVKTKSYKIQINKYFANGIVYRVFHYDEYEKILQYQNETGLQILYPYVDKKDTYVTWDEEAGQYVPMSSSSIADVSQNPNIWYKCVDTKGTPLKDSAGNYVPAYSTNKAAETIPYTSQRIEGDDGSYIYCTAKSGSVQARVCYYNYYIYLNGHEPTYVFGTNEMGQDLFMAIGIGARFSLIFAVLVSAINLTIGAVYGAIQGFYGGTVDLVLDRIADILSGVPFIVVATLFQLHLAQKVGTVPSFLFAFVLTGWIGMAALTRKQFYRFKGQEYVMAAKTLGASDWRLMFKHIFPNSLGTIITSCVLVIPGVVSSETTLTYLGIVNLSDFAGTTIGTLMSQGQTAMMNSPHAMLFPSLFISLLLISFNLFGNGLRDAFNPTTRGVED